MSINFFGTKVSWICGQGQLCLIDKYIKSNKSKYITYTNVHVVVTARKDLKLSDSLKNADLVSPDGMPLVKIGTLAGAHCMEKCSGPDMMLKTIEYGLDRGYKHFFYGSTDETLKALELKLKEKYPSINIVGKYSPPFRVLTDEEDHAIIDRINNLNPDCIWIGLGAPKQEIWMHEHKGKIKRGVMFGVGAAFDFHAELLQRAPAWMQKYGLEWLYRLSQEPRRLFRNWAIRPRRVSDAVMI